MTDRPIPVLWITGPAGVGKSAVSWLLFTELARAGTPIAFVDADQLCMLYPAPPADPGRDRIRTRNADALIENYRRSGARCVIVNGFVDPLAGVGTDLAGQAMLTVCRLRADPDEVARRLTGRHGSESGLNDALRQVRDECGRMDASGFADVCVDTTGVSVAGAAQLVRDGCHGWPGWRNLDEPASQQPRLTRAGPAGIAGTADAEPSRPGWEPGRGGPEPDAAAGECLLICGPAGVGKSTVGFELYVRCVRAGRTAGYIDLDQIGFLRPARADDLRRHRLKACNLAAMWHTYQAAGATHLVITGAVQDQAALNSYVTALPAVTVTACRLHAGPADLTRRIMSRGDGGSWHQPGDPLRGQPHGYLSQIAVRAAADSVALDRAHIDAVRVDTSALSAGDAADLVAAATGWPRRRPG